MKPKRVRCSLFVPAVLGLTLVPTFAADMASTIKPFTSAMPIMQACTMKVQQLAQLRPPANHAAARLAAATNAATGTNKLPISPADQQFMNAMYAGQKDLDTCAAQLTPFTKSMPAYKKQVNDALKKAGTGPTQWSKADAKTVFDAMTAYDKTHQDFAKALPMLSGDQQLQSYLHKSILNILAAFAN
jgi:hypothetical protein